MANTYTQIHIHAVFTVQDRDSIICNSWKEELYKYLTGIIQNYNHKVLAINGMPDHVHVFFGMRPSQSLADLMQNVKGDSSKWIHSKGFVRGKFSWQEGYGAFSYGRSNVDQVIRYIQNQELHHKKKSFIEEYREFLTNFGIEYTEQYLFKQVHWNDPV